MESRCLYITGRSAIKLMRAARAGKLLSASPADITRVESFDPSLLSDGEPEMLEFLSWLNISNKSPLDVLVTNDQDRCYLSKINTQIVSGEVPHGAFLELHSAVHSDMALRIPRGVRIYISGPALCLIYIARKLQARKKKGIIDRQVMSLRLIEFACECCGYYARDPLAPFTGDCHFDKPGQDSRFTNLKSLASQLENMSGMLGCKYARDAIVHALDQLGSPSETYVNLACTLPPRLGGLKMEKPRINEQLTLDGDNHSPLRHKTIRPDMHWPKYHMLIEYLGDDHHKDKSARIEDKNRLLDYSEAHYLAFVLMFDDINNAAALNRTAEMLARAFMERGKKGELYRVRRLIGDEKFLDRQLTLLKTLLPPVTRYE